MMNMDVREAEKAVIKAAHGMRDGLVASGSDYDYLTRPTNYLSDREDSRALSARKVLSRHREARMNGDDGPRMIEMVELMRLADLTVDQAASTYLFYDLGFA